MVGLLLELGADPLMLNAAGQTPLHCAAVQGHEEALKQLLQALLVQEVGADTTVLGQGADADGAAPYQQPHQQQQAVPMHVSERAAAVLGLSGETPMASAITLQHNHLLQPLLEAAHSAGLLRRGGPALGNAGDVGDAAAVSGFGSVQQAAVAAGQQLEDLHVSTQPRADTDTQVEGPAQAAAGPSSSMEFIPPHAPQPAVGFASPFASSIASPFASSIALQVAKDCQLEVPEGGTLDATDLSSTFAPITPTASAHPIGQRPAAAAAAADFPPPTSSAAWATHGQQAAVAAAGAQHGLAAQTPSGLLKAPMLRLYGCAAWPFTSLKSNYPCMRHSSTCAECLLRRLCCSSACPLHGCCSSFPNACYTKPVMLKYMAVPIVVASMRTTFHRAST